MKRAIVLTGAVLLMTGCEQSVEKTRGVVAPERVEAEAPSIGERAEALKEQGFQSFTYEEGDTTYLMQQYFLVFLKAGDNRNQDSTEIATLQQEHLAHLNRMAEEGFTSLTGPLGSDGDIRGIVVYNTPTLEEADSLAHLDPAVQAGRLKVEIHPWWTAKGGKLK